MRPARRVCSCACPVPLALLALLSACVPNVGKTDRNPAQAPLPTVDLCLRDGSKSTSLTAERAVTPEQRRRGLMGRKTLAADAGMLFEYGRKSDGNFWMHRTLLPLDIAYLGPDGVIRAIQSMDPCPDGADEADGADESGANCPGYPAGVTYWSALEVNKGYFEREDFDVGAYITKSAPADCTVEPK